MLSVELTEFADRVVRNNVAVQEEFQLELTMHQHRVPEINENLLMSMSDGLLRAVQHWVTSRRFFEDFDATNSGTNCSPHHKKFRSADKYSSVCLFSLDSTIITYHVSKVRLAEL